jgi:ribosomal protein L14E/L6E/L27E
MEIDKSDIVRSVNGRDAGKVFFVCEMDGEYAMIADGKSRRLEKPKRKKLKHLAFVAKTESRVALKIQSGEKVSNGDIRKALAIFMAGGDEAEGGM